MPLGVGSVAALPELYERLLRPLNAAGIRYMITGGLAAIVYGEPRLTNDVDVVVHLTSGDAERLHHAFDHADYYVPPLEVIEAEATRKAFGHFNVLHVSSALRADVYCVGDDPFGAWALEHSRSIPIGNELISLAPIEYVIVQKLRYFREAGSERHVRDIDAMLRVSGNLVDMRVLEYWVEQLQLQTVWGQVRASE
jgi:hypothetical protein